MPLITTAEFRLHYPQQATAYEDTALTAMIDEADDLIAAYCGYPETTTGIHTMQSATYEIYVDRPSPMEADALCVCVHPIISITSIHASSSRVYDGTTILTAGTDYTFDARNGVIILTATSTRTWPTAWRGTKVVMVAGYATTPPGLRMIAVAAVRHLWNLRNDAGKASYSALGVSQTNVDTDVLLPQSVKDALRAGYMTPCALAALQEAA